MWSILSGTPLMNKLEIRLVFLLGVGSELLSDHVLDLGWDF